MSSVAGLSPNEQCPDCGLLFGGRTSPANHVNTPFHRAAVARIAAAVDGERRRALHLRELLVEVREAYANALDRDWRPRPEPDRERLRRTDVALAASADLARR